jgi:hypothetical protein
MMKGMGGGGLNFGISSIWGRRGKDKIWILGRTFGLHILLIDHGQIIDFFYGI